MKLGKNVGALHVDVGRVPDALALCPASARMIVIQKTLSMERFSIMYGQFACLRLIRLTIETLPSTSRRFLFGHEYRANKVASRMNDGICGGWTG